MDESTPRPPPHPPPPCDLRRIRPTASALDLLFFVLGFAQRGTTLWSGFRGWVPALWRMHARESGATDSLTRPDAPCTRADPRGPELGSIDLRGTVQEPEAFDPARELANLLANAEAEDIAVTWYERAVEIGGFVYRPDERQARRRDRATAPVGLDARSLPAVTVGETIIVLNPAQDFTTTFDVLLHEVAHVLLGHTGARQPVGRGTMRVPHRTVPWQNVREVEANLATALAGRRRGHAPRSIERLFAERFDAAKAADQLGEVDLSWVVPVADVLAAWCKAPPDGDTVRAVGDAPRPGSLAAVLG